MARKYFTEEEIEILQANPYTKKVSSSTITYTQEFREFFVNEYDTGSTPSHILIKAGFNPKMFGTERIHSISKSFRKMAKREDGFSDTRKGNSGRPATKDLTRGEEIKRLKQKVNYLEQENIFLKKIHFLDRKAKYAHDRKKNSKSFQK